MKNKASQVVCILKPDLNPVVTYHPLAAAWSGPLLLWKPLIYPSARLNFTFSFLFFFKVHICFKNRGHYFGERRVFSLSRYLERKSKAPTRQKIFLSETKFSRKQASLTTLAQLERTNEQLFSEASFRLSRASLRLVVRCPAGGLGSRASPVVRGTGGDWPRWYQDSGGSSLRQTWKRMALQNYHKNIIYTHG